MTTSPYPRFFPERPLSPSRSLGSRPPSRPLTRARSLSCHTRTRTLERLLGTGAGHATCHATYRVRLGAHSTLTALAQHSICKEEDVASLQALVCDGDAPAGQPGRSGPDHPPHRIRKGVCSGHTGRRRPAAVSPPSHPTRIRLAAARAGRAQAGHQGQDRLGPGPSEDHIPYQNVPG